MNAYEKFLAELAPEDKDKLAGYQCMWCSQYAMAGKCGASEMGCAPESRVEKAKNILKRAKS